MSYIMCRHRHTFTGIVVVQGGRPPRLLYETWTASFTLVTTGVVLTTADETKWIARISQITAVSVTVAHTSTAN